MVVINCQIIFNIRESPTVRKTSTTHGIRYLFVIASNEVNDIKPAFLRRL